MLREVAVVVVQGMWAGEGRWCLVAEEVVPASTISAWTNRILASSSSTSRSVLSPRLRPASWSRVSGENGFGTDASSRLLECDVMGMRGKGRCRDKSDLPPSLMHVCVREGDHWVVVEERKSRPRVIAFAG